MPPLPRAVVEQLKADYRRSYALADDLTEADLDATARAEAALRSMMAENHLHAMSFQFLAFGEDENTETLPFVAVSRMMAEGMGFAGEGDLVGAAGTWFLNRLHPPASFSEIFTIDFAGNGLLLSHMGEANAAMARKDRPVPLLARPEPIIAHPRPAARVGQQLPARSGNALRLGARAARAMASDRRPARHSGLRSLECPVCSALPRKKPGRRSRLADRLRQGRRPAPPRHSALAMRGRN